MALPDQGAHRDTAPAREGRAGVILPYLFLCLAVLAWSGNWIVGRAMRHEIGPIAMGFWRWLLALGVLLPFCWRELIQKRELVKRNWVQLMLLGGIGAMAFNTMLYIGLQYTEATNATLYNSTVPVYIALISWLAFGERIGFRQGVGILVSVVGVLTIISRGTPSTLMGLTINAGDIWIIVAMFLWSMYTILLRWRPAELAPAAFLSSMLIFSLPIMLPFYLWEWSTRGGFELKFSTATAIAYFAVVPSVLAYLMWNRGVMEVGPNRAGLIVHLMPIFTVVLALVFLGEPVLGYHYAGATFVFAGIWLTTGVSRSTEF